MSSSSSTTKHKRSRTTSSSVASTTGRHTSQPQPPLKKTEIIIHVYDLLPPGRLSSLLWTVGGSLLHSGVVINDREYAYGGHDRKGVTGVYWTKPRFEPPGGTFRCEILQGFTLQPTAEIDAIVRDVSLEFLGSKYNLLTCNCNHFTSVMCERLTGRAAPGWLNRAASIGVALPCVVPKEWVAPPEADTADGELLDEEGEDLDEEEENEVAGMLASDQRRRQKEERRRRRDSNGGGGGGLDLDEDEEHSLAGGRRILARDGTPPPRLVSVKDTSGRTIPVAERAPIPKKT